MTMTADYTDTTPLRDLAVELKRQMTTKRDMVADTRRFSLSPHRELAEDEVAAAKVAPLVAVLDAPSGAEDFGVTRLAHQQIGEFTNVPWKLYERLLTKHPGKLTSNPDWAEKAALVAA